MAKRQPSARKQEAVIAALVGGATYAQAAQKAKVSERTVGTWVKDLGFKAQLREARLAVVERTITAVQSISLNAVATLARNMSCGVPATEVRAADCLLSRAVEGVELFDLIGRVDELEQIVKAQRAGYDNRNTFGQASTTNGQHPR
jgi:hypothetical protein